MIAAFKGAGLFRIAENVSLANAITESDGTCSTNCSIQANAGLPAFRFRLKIGKKSTEIRPSGKSTRNFSAEMIRDVSRRVSFFMINFAY